MKYTIFVAYSLKGNDYTERPNLECCYHLYNSKEEAIKAVIKPYLIKEGE